MRPSPAWIVLIALLGACDGGRGGPAAGGPGPTSTDPIGGPAATDPPPSDALVYGHSSTMLYTVDANTLAVKSVGAFSGVRGGEEMTDIAIDKDGKMIGITYGAVYAIDKATAKCTFLSTFAGGDFNGLSFIAADQIDASGEEILVGAAIDGSVYEIDPATGQQTKRGAYGGGHGSSGDLVSVEGVTYATVTSGTSSGDLLVKIDAKNGHVVATIGDTGTRDIWGLGYWKQRLFGFTASDGLVLIDVHTAKTTPVAGGNVGWYGAGVTTAAPVTVQ